jgi:hypothetical protein
MGINLSYDSTKAFPSARKTLRALGIAFARWIMSCLTSSKERTLNFLVSYMLQKAQLFHEQPRVACTIAAFASLGGRKSGSSYCMGEKYMFANFGQSYNF